MSERHPEFDMSTNDPQNRSSDRRSPSEDAAAEPASKRDPAQMSVDHLTQAFATLMDDSPVPAVDVPTDEVNAKPRPAGDGPSDETAINVGLAHAHGLPQESSEAERRIALGAKASTPSDPLSDEDPSPVTPEAIVEAILFVGHPENDVISARLVASYLRGVSPQEVDQLIVHLNEQYLAEAAPYEIVSEGSGYRMTLRDEFVRVRESFYGRVREAKLSQAAIDLLAIVAYRQPIQREQIERLRGQPCSGVLNQLVRRQLLMVEIGKGRPRTKTYRTTDRFLDLFQLDSLDDLPRHEEV